MARQGAAGSPPSPPSPPFLPVCAQVPHRRAGRPASGRVTAQVCRHGATFPRNPCLAWVSVWRMKRNVSATGPAGALPVAAWRIPASSATLPPHQNPCQPSMLRRCGILWGGRPGRRGAACGLYTPHNRIGWL
ncbi:hypothetical protein SAMN05421863_10336 [Nitrosomonas communis]|uniref:Uncharacterized protein n=1 Tax=Nitrosomonas communis TaxID=44574 RepID=A0A1I4RHE6_9PROT|nr:hypothetical protein SAMN05421863_10336 [Nitrosomonas communis]